MLGCREDPGAVLMILDGDDRLAGPSALDTIRSAYERRSELLFTWGNSAFGSTDSGGRGGATPPEIIAARAFRRDHTHICHPRTFRSRLWYALRRRDLTDPQTGNLLRVGGDIGFIIPMLEMAGNRIQFIQDVVHVYNTTNPISDFRVRADEQQRVNEHIRSLPPYPLLESVEQRNVIYRSQYGQDKFVIEEVFRGRRDGVFVDVGAYDGITFSNSCALERHYGWTGLCVEPLPHVFARLRRARSCACVRAAVGTMPGDREMTWVEGDSEMLSGLSDTYVAPHRDRIARETAANGGARRIMKVQCRRLDELLAQHGIRRVDYLSVDVEGAELEVLASIDLQRMGVECLTVENNYEDERIGSFLGERGYERIHTIKCDEVYRRRRGR
jgi:FkbM family methyltransferase